MFLCVCVYIFNLRSNITRFVRCFETRVSDCHAYTRIMNNRMGELSLRNYFNAVLIVVIKLKPRSGLIIMGRNNPIGQILTSGLACHYAMSSRGHEPETIQYV